MPGRLNSPSIDYPSLFQNHALTIPDVSGQSISLLETEQAQLEQQVAELELERETLKTELLRFQKRYYEQVGRLYAELDAVRVELARQDLCDHPDDAELKAQLEAAEQRARLSAEEAGLIESRPVSPEITADCRKIYRKAAMLMHPDRATSDVERERRTKLMARVNLAYESGDVAAIENMIFEFGVDPESVEGADLSSRMERLRRRIAQLKRRQDEVAQEMDELRFSEICRLRNSVEAAEALGENPLAGIARKLVQEISLLRRKIRH